MPIRVWVIPTLRRWQTISFKFHFTQKIYINNIKMSDFTISERLANGEWVDEDDYYSSDGEESKGYAGEEASSSDEDVNPDGSVS